MSDASRALVAGITIYRPDPALLLDLIDRLERDDIAILAEIDGPTGEAVSAELLERLRARTGLELAQNARNEGIGAALNRLADRARQRGAERILLFDQDSTPPPGIATALSARMDALLAAGERPAAIGPTPISPEGGTVEYRPPRYQAMPGRTEREGARPVRFIISSGTLLDLSSYARIGPFRSDYIVDAIDTEWCFRAWKHGRSIWVARDISMEHRIGHAVIRRGPISFPRQSPARMATYIRNQAHGLRLRHVPWSWKLRTVAYLPLQAIVYSLEQPRPLRSFGQLARAASHGLAGRLGRIDMDQRA